MASDFAILRKRKHLETMYMKINSSKIVVNKYCFSQQPAKIDPDL